MQETQDLSLGRQDPPEKGMAIHSSILAWRVPWTEEPGGLPSMGSGCTESDMTQRHTHTLSCLLRIPCVLLLQIGQFEGISKTSKSCVELNMIPGVLKVVVLVIVKNLVTQQK